MEESDHVFGKRRRNLMIVGTLIIILAIIFPVVKNINLFSIQFTFSNRNWLIWLGLTLWLVYTYIRAWSYYKTYNAEIIKATRNRFIYWEHGGDNYWIKFNNNNRQKEENRLKSEEHSRVRELYFSGDMNEVLLNYVEVGRIPGQVPIPVVKKYAAHSEQENEILIVDFVIEQEAAAHFRDRKRAYGVNDNLWEYSFTWIYGWVAVGFLIVGWVRVILA